VEPVSARPSGASFFGALGMAGNVFEWVEDRMSLTYPAAPQVDPRGPGDGITGRVVRGGDWASALSECEATRRTSCAPSGGSDRIGFRVGGTPR